MNPLLQKLQCQLEEITNSHQEADDIHLIKQGAYWYDVLWNNCVHAGKSQ